MAKKSIQKFLIFLRRKEILQENHLKKVKESYFEHLLFASKAGIKLCGYGLVSILHAIFPIFFPRYVSKKIILMYNKINSRDI